MTVPQELTKGSVLVVTHRPKCLAVRVKTVHGHFKGVGYLIETQEGNLALVRGWLGFTADITFFPKETTLEQAIAQYNTT
jgi:hypothetical protein